MNGLRRDGKEMEIGPPPEWQAIVQAIAAEPGVVMIIGASDTGKTTLAKFLVRELSRQELQVGFVDADIGQSTIGPPTTIGLAVFDRKNQAELEKNPWQPVALHFVGSFSPRGHLLETVVGTKRLVERAQSLGANVIVVDTTGLVFGAIGAHLKYQKVLLIMPRHLILLQRKGELESLSNLFTTLSGTRIYKLAMVSGVKSRNREARRQYRLEKLRQYFRHAEVRWIDFPPLILWRNGHFCGSRLNPADLEFASRLLEGQMLYGEKGGRVLFLVARDAVVTRYLSSLEAKFGVEHVAIVRKRDLTQRLCMVELDNQKLLQLAILLDLDFSRQRMKLLVPPEGWQGVRLLQLGSEIIEIEQGEAGGVVLHLPTV